MLNVLLIPRIIISQPVGKIVLDLPQQFFHDLVFGRWVIIILVQQGFIAIA